MAAVIETAPQPEETPGDTAQRGAPEAPAALTAFSSVTGLKPIERLTSDTRYAKIIPDSAQVTTLKYSSIFVRTFLRSDYNFCASKISVAREGKLRALDQAIRETSEWFTMAIAWTEQLGARQIPRRYETIELEVKRPLAGQLVRCLTQYERLFARAWSAHASHLLSQERCTATLANAEKKLNRVTLLCVPDNDEYDFDGARLER
ncbi:DUF1845 domain-containing protein [Paraburkholderia tagetis]|uniref:DUF1845 domain-containing protein n=1 Tax=Paraburkholderia tagetis TaxID=2913261 RepID=A0A9X1RTV6_9BURK|nr:DUF1845 domain-containing protein [Paraburkholderia tagetis]MCG5077235.1 DUF1845 domain-containing protein [Paraburkholderia tagetis]